MVAAITFLLLASLQTNLTAFMVGRAWDVKKQRDVVALGAAQMVKDSVLAKLEYCGANDARALSDIVDDRISSIWAGNGSVVTDITDYSTLGLPSLSQWPDQTPPSVSDVNFSSSSGMGLGRGVQSILSAGPVSDLGGGRFTFSVTSADNASESSTFAVDVRMFSVPLTNFSLIPYGDPAVTNRVVSDPPPAFSFTKGAGFSQALVHKYRVGASGAFPDLYPAAASGAVFENVPFFYRDLVGISWNAVSAWRSVNYQNLIYLRSLAQATAYDFQSPSTIPPGLSGVITRSGGKTRINLGSALVPSIITIDDALGGGDLVFDGTTAAGATSPVLILVRNSSANKTSVTFSGNNTRPILLYAQNCSLSGPGNPSIRGAILYFPNSSTTAPFSLAGSLIYPQSLSAAPNITVVPDRAAQIALAQIAPRALVVSAKAVAP